MKSGRRNFFLLLLCFVFAGCPARDSNFPAVEPTDHRGVRQIVEQQKGNVVLLNVWATWCAPCREEMPALVSIYREFRDKGFSLVLVSADEPDLLRTNVQPMLKRFGVDFPSYINTGNEEAFMTALHPDWSGALPTSFLYDRNGNLVDVMMGSRTLDEFKRAIVKLMGSQG